MTFSSCPGPSAAKPDREGRGNRTRRDGRKAGQHKERRGEERERVWMGKRKHIEAQTGAICTIMQGPYKVIRFSIYYFLGVLYKFMSKDKNGKKMAWQKKGKKKANMSTLH